MDGRAVTRVASKRKPRLARMTAVDALSRLDREVPDSVSVGASDACLVALCGGARRWLLRIDSALSHRSPAGLDPQQRRPAPPPSPVPKARPGEPLIGVVAMLAKVHQRLALLEPLPADAAARPGSIELVEQSKSVTLDHVEQLPGLALDQVEDGPAEDQEARP